MRVVRAVAGDGHDPGPAPAGHRVPALVADRRSALDFGWTTPVGGSARPCPTRWSGSSRTTADGWSARRRWARSRSRRTGDARVRTSDGRAGAAPARAVVAGAHLAQLAAHARGRPSRPADLPSAPGHLAARALSVLRGARRARAATSASAPPGHPQRGRRLRRHRGLSPPRSTRTTRGEPDADDPWLLVVNQTVVDPTRAPRRAGDVQDPHHRAVRARRRAGVGRHQGRVRRAAGRPGPRSGPTGSTGDDVLSLRAESPVDVAGHNPHNLGGSCHGGEFLRRRAGHPGMDRATAPACPACS